MTQKDGVPLSLGEVGYRLSNTREKIKGAVEYYQRKQDKTKAVELLDEGLSSAREFYGDEFDKWPEEVKKQAVNAKANLHQPLSEQEQQYRSVVLAKSDET